MVTSTDAVPSTSTRQGSAALPLFLVIFAALLRIWNFPHLQETRDLDELMYVPNGLMAWEGLAPAMRTGPSGPQTWLGWFYAGSIFYAAQCFWLVEFRTLFYFFCVVGVRLGTLQSSLCGDFEFQVADFFGECRQDIQSMLCCRGYFWMQILKEKISWDANGQWFQLLI